MTSPIIPLVTPADKALVRELFTLYFTYLMEPDKVSAKRLRSVMEVRLAKHRVEGFVSAAREYERPPLDTPAPRGRKAKGRGKVLPPYHWRKCE